MTPRPSPAVCKRSSRSRPGSPKKRAPPLLLEGEQGTLNGTDARRRDVPVLGAEGRRLVADETHHRLQVFEVEQQQPLVVGYLEDQVEDSGLGLIEVEEPGQQ
ncbi:hypothetical protein JCM30471_10980 [Desulfuromonas carbonis]